jgi:hypothetical protein
VFFAFRSRFGFASRRALLASLSVAACLMSLWTADVIAQTANDIDYTVDLADGNQSQRVVAGTKVRIRITNKLPGEAYSWEVTNSRLLSPLATNEFNGTPETGTRATSTPGCAAASATMTKVDAARSEAELRAAIVSARATSDPCGTNVEQLTSTTLPGTYTIADGETLVIRVWRKGQRWLHQLTTTDDRQWLIHYGFSLVPDDNDEYFTASDGSGGFAITQATASDDYDFEPTIAFSFVPRRSVNRPLMPKFTAGLGVDIDERLFFGGASWIIGDNISIFAGIAAHKQTRLKGLYRVGQTLQENLQADQLVDDKYDINPMIGIGFRFDRNPFSRRDPAPAPTTTPPNGGGTPPNTPAAPPAPVVPGAAGNPGGGPAAGAENPPPPSGGNN